MESGDYLARLDQENWPVKTTLGFLPFFDCRWSANFDEIIENGYLTDFRNRSNRYATSVPFGGCGKSRFFSLSKLLRKCYLPDLNYY